MNLPIFRAKKKDSDEYVIGFYSVAYDIHHYIITHLGVDTKVDVVYQMSTDIHKIDPTTLSISFPDMLDSQGNRIFASLSEDGKGGDIFILGDERLKYISMIHNNQLMAKQQNTYGSFIGQGYAPTNKWKIIEIKE